MEARDTRLNRLVAIKVSLSPFSERFDREARAIPGVNTAPQSHPDGQRFLVEVPMDQRAPRTSLSVVLNWPALLKR